MREVVTGVPQFNTEYQDVCRGCSLGKFTKAFFSSSNNRLVGILDLKHTDVCGPMYRVPLSGLGIISLS
jgi:hypothetical protein